MHQVAPPAAPPISTMRSPPRNALRPVKRLSAAPTPNSAMAARSPRAMAGCSARPSKERHQRHDRTERERDERRDRRADGRTEIVGVQAELLARERIERRRFVLHEFAADVTAPLPGPCRAPGRSARAPRPLLPGIPRSSSRSSPIWYSNISRCERIETYSPAAIESAPASSPATPVVSDEIRARTPRRPRP